MRRDPNARSATRLRIVGGSLGGRLIQLPARDGAVRPTSDRLREAIASALEARDAFSDRLVLDLFAGSGALSFEALSRGASRAVLVDHDPVVMRAVSANAKSLDIAERVRTVLADLFVSSESYLRGIRAVATEPFDLVFCDPPYARLAELPRVVSSLLDAGLLAPDAIVVVERPASLAPTPPAPSMELLRDYRHGSSSAALFRTSGQPSATNGVPSLDR